MRLFDAGEFHVGFGIVVPSDEETTEFSVQGVTRNGRAPFRHSLAATLYADSLCGSAPFSPELEDAFVSALAELIDLRAELASSDRGSTDVARSAEAQKPIGEDRLAGYPPRTTAGTIRPSDEYSWRPENCDWPSGGHGVQTSGHHRIERLSPVAIRVVHHDVDHYRQEPAEHLRPIADLVAIYAAIPGGTAMDQLVAQHIEPIEQGRQDLRGLAAMARAMTFLLEARRDSQSA